MKKYICLQSFTAYSGKHYYAATIIDQLELGILSYMEQQHFEPYVVDDISKVIGYNPPAYFKS